jgi:hypothetical protein
MATEWNQEAGMTGGVSVDNVREFSEIAEENADASAVSAASSEASAVASASSAASASASASQASTSAANSATSASQSATSATASANSASSANTSANNASASASQAAISATAASTSEDNAAASATAASGHANDAAVSEANAATSEANAAASEASAGADAIATAADRVQTGLDVIATAADRVQTGLDAIAADNSATAASASASSAASSASTATTQAGIATTQAGVAALNATSAADSASSASTSASNAAASATSAQASLDEFQGQYHGALATAPTVGVDAGDLYFDTVIEEMMVYSGTEWKKAGSTINGTSNRESFTATEGQTVFTLTSGYDANFADVYLNGVKLVNGVDVDVTSGTGFTLATGATAGDVVDFIGYGAFVLADHYTKSEADANFIEDGDVITVSGGNVGIGTGSPPGAFSVYRETGASQWAIQTLNNVNTGGSGFWQRANGSHEMVLRDLSNNANFITNQSNDLEFVTNGSERMRIDPVGRVTMPYQPMFQVSLQNPVLDLDGAGGWISTTSTNGTTGGAWSWGLNTGCYNVGGHWNASNNRFTAPVDGTYMFMNIWHYAGSSTTSGSRYSVNGGSYFSYSGTMYSSDGAAINPHMHVAYFKLNAGDYVDLHIGYTRSGTLYGTTTALTRTHWSGQLIG